MRESIHAVVLATCWLVAGCAGSEPARRADVPLEAEMSVGQLQMAARADEVEWGACPPALPTGCEMAVLEGNPKKDMVFTVRFRTVGRFELRPHWHPRNERVTVLDGRVGVGFGDEIDRGAVSWFGPGDYYVNAKEAHHFVLADGPTVLQITGIGPWEVHYVDGP